MARMIPKRVLSAVARCDMHCGTKTARRRIRGVRREGFGVRIAVFTRAADGAFSLPDAYLRARRWARRLGAAMRRSRATRWLAETKPRSRRDEGRDRVHVFVRWQAHETAQYGASCAVLPRSCANAPFRQSEGHDPRAVWFVCPALPAVRMADAKRRAKKSAAEAALLVLPVESARAAWRRPRTHHHHGPASWT